MSDPAEQSVAGDLVSPSVRRVIQAFESEALVSEGAAPATEASKLLNDLNTDPLLVVPVKSAGDARAMLAGLWLWVGGLDASHAISQNLHTPTGSFWHAIMHRREGDFANAKYWYARCRNHPAIADAAARAGCRWEPDPFVDLVERVHTRPADPAHAQAVRLQRIEWAALFDHCVRAAAGNPDRHT